VKLIFAAILASTILLSGCAIKPIPSQPRDSYNWYGSEQGEGAAVKTVRGIKVWSVDGQRIASILEVMTGKAFDALKLAPGRHSMIATVDGRDMKIGAVNYEAGHEYLIDMLKVGDRTYYWVEDTTSGQVVYGKKKTVEEFLKD